MHSPGIGNWLQDCKQTIMINGIVLSWGEVSLNKFINDLERGGKSTLMKSEDCIKARLCLIDVRLPSGDGEAARGAGRCQGENEKKKKPSAKPPPLTPQTLPAFCFPITNSPCRCQTGSSPPTGGRVWPLTRARPEHNPTTNHPNALNSTRIRFPPFPASAEKIPILWRSVPDESN